MIANPQYGRVGIFAMPIFTFAEAIGPLIEGLGYVLVPIAFLLGAVNFPFVVLFFQRRSQWGSSCHGSAC
jgi:hypothetical protein